MRKNYAWLLEIDADHGKKINYTTYRGRLRVADILYRPLPFPLLGLENGNWISRRTFPEIINLSLKGDDEDSRRTFEQLGDPMGRSLALRRVRLEDKLGSEMAVADYRVIDVTTQKDGFCCSLKRVTNARCEHTKRHRVVRKIRRSVNELRSIYEELFKRERINSWPVTLNLNHTAVCNLRCTMCLQAFGVAQEIMDISVYRRIRDELFDRISVLDLTVMGDPFCVPKSFFNEILDDVKRYDLRLTMTTNATLFPNDEQLDRIVRLASRITISFDGATKETFERIRVGAKWGDTTSNIERLNRARLRQPFYRRPYLAFNYVLMRSNQEELPLFVELAKGWGGSGITVAPVLKIHPSLEPEMLDDSDPHLRQTVREAKRRASRIGIGLNTNCLPMEKSNGFSDRALLVTNWGRSIQRQLKAVLCHGLNHIYQTRVIRLDRAPRRCPFLWNKVYIGYNGNVSTCCHPNFISAGDIRRSGFQEVWNGRIYSHLRKTLNTDKVTAPCKDCHLFR